MIEKGLTNSQKGVVWCLVVAGHSLAVWGLLWTKVPQLPSAVVTPLQVEWIELANLATPATPTNQPDWIMPIYPNLTQNLNRHQF